MTEREDISGDDLLFDRMGPLAIITLNRPDALNALSHEMALAMEKRLHRYAEDDDVAAIVVRGAGDRAFCAGGDVRRLYDDGLSGGPYPYRFYPDEYRLNAYIFHYPKPYIPLIDGIDMGGGVGISVHGSHRVVTERLNFAMPETGIGLFPDVGGSYFLPRLPGELGTYMALTGSRLKAADAVYANVGDAYVPSDRLDDLVSALAQAPFNRGPQTAASRILMDFKEEPGESSMEALQPQIDETFCHDTVEEIIAALEAEGSEWARETIETMRTKSPTSMKIALRQIRTGATLDFYDCMRMEWRIAYGCIHGHDFYEGVRAVIVDKDNAPKWKPATIEEVSDADIAPYFEDEPKGGDLQFDPPSWDDDADMQGDEAP